MRVADGNRRAALRLWRLLGQHHLQHTVLAACTDLAAVSIGRQAERAVEAAKRALQTEGLVVWALLAVLLFAVARDAEDVVLELDLRWHEDCVIIL